ncbi:MAG: Ldh family oxidoreductase [Proteobacteria bacterium]|nr:Ldh family oxidoreductase [Pseudomonadota bacterium]
MIELTLKELDDLVINALTSFGLTHNDMRIVADVLLWAELRGNSQGLGKILARAVVPHPDAGEIVVTRRSAVVTQIEANLNLGMVVMDRAVDEAIRSARSNGIGVVGTRGTTTSTGAIGYFSERAANAGFLCMIYGGTPKAVAPFGSVDAIFGTNPISFAIPTTDKPLVVDMGTSAETWFGLLQAERLAESIKPNLAFDSDGISTTNPGAALRGAIRAFGGAKGSALALLIEILAGPLAGGAIFNDAEHQSGNVLIVLDPDLFGFGDSFCTRVTALIDSIRSSSPIPGGAPPLIPGESSRKTFERAQSSGRIALDKALIESIRAISAK